MGLSELLNVFIDSSKQKYHSRVSRKLSDPSSSSKCYLLILKSFVSTKETSILPPLLDDKGNFVNDFKVKCNLFNRFFAQLCPIIKNGSKLASGLLKQPITHLMILTLTEMTLKKLYVV